MCSGAARWLRSDGFANMVDPAVLEGMGFWIRNAGAVFAAGLGGRALLHGRATASMDIRRLYSKRSRFLEQFLKPLQSGRPQ